MKHSLLLPLAAAFVSNALYGQGTCATAMSIGLGQHTVATLAGEPSTLICVGGVTPTTAGAWYSFTATNDTTVQLSTHVAGYPDVDTRFHVYSGACGALVCYAGDDDSGPNYSSIGNFEVVTGETYLILFDNYWTGSGFTFTLDELNAPPPPSGVVTFTNTPIPGSGSIMGVVDMNNDGMDDAVSPGYTSFIVSYQQSGPTFSPTTYATSAAANTASWSFAIGDWDSNGHRDLLYGGGSGATFMKADATGTAYTQVTFPQYIFCQRTNFVDINQDGHLDAFSCHDVDANVAFLNDGNGNLIHTQGGYGTTCGNYGSIWTDYNDDGNIDLFVAKCGCDPVDLIMSNNGSGVFTSNAASLGLADSHQAWSSAWGDFDNDSDMDLFVGSSGGGVHKLMRNNGDGTFTNVTVGSGMDTFGGSSIEWTSHDFNNDGLIDLLGGGAMHYNMGNLIFSHDATAPGNHAIGDLNNDGFMDIATSGGYWRNGGNTNNWIKIIPIGTVSNRDAIGARIYVTSALGTQMREVRSGDGFRYMSYIGAYFGLGSDTEVEQVVIRWPNGEVETFENPSINSSHSYVEEVSTTIANMDVAPVFGVYPNPTADMLTLTGATLNTAVEILDATGKLVLRTRSNGDRVNVGPLAPGVYQLVVVDGSNLHQARFTKQ